MFQILMANNMEDNYDTMREVFKELIGLTIVKGETKEKNEQVEMLKTTLRAHSVYVTTNYLNAVFERVVMGYYSSFSHAHYFTPVTSPIKRKRVISMDDRSTKKFRTEQYDPEEDPSILMHDLDQSAYFIRPERFHYLDFRRDVKLVVHVGQMSELYESTLSWENDAQFCCDFDQENLLITKEDIENCIGQVFNGGKTISSMEKIIETQLAKHDALVDEYKEQYKLNKTLFEELRELERLEQESSAEPIPNQQDRKQNIDTPVIARVKT
jgi:hypothetical protein